MRADLSLLASLLVTSVAAGVIESPEPRVDIADIAEPEARDAEWDDLWKRRGGGGSRPPSGGSRPPSGGSSGSRPPGGGGSNRPTTNTYSNSNAGGYSNGGSGPQPRFVGGQYYGGGAKVPFTAGAPRGGITPYPVSGRGLAFWPGPWLPYPVYMYPYGSSYHYHNRTSDEDEERPVLCACQEYNVCSCEEIEDDDDFEDMFEELLEDGDYNKMNHTLVTVGEVNGTKTIMINGTLPNGTTVNSDNPEDYEEFLENAAVKLAHRLGVMPLVVAVAAVVFVV